MSSPSAVASRSSLAYSPIVSSMPKRAPSTRTRLSSTSEARPSRSPPHTSSAASSEHPPTKTERRRKSARWSSSRRSTLQPIVSRNARCRAGASRGPEVSNSRLRSRRPSIALGASSLTRAAASSTASGRQSSRSQIVSIAAISVSSGSKSGRTARARSRNKLTASARVSGSRSSSTLAAHSEARSARHRNRQVGARCDHRCK